MTVSEETQPWPFRVAVCVCCVRCVCEHRPQTDLIISRAKPVDLFPTLWEPEETPCRNTFVQPSMRSAAHFTARSRESEPERSVRYKCAKLVVRIRKSEVVTRYSLFLSVVSFVYVGGVMRPQLQEGEGELILLSS